jgi:hypothetical protein
VGIAGVGDHYTSGSYGEPVERLPALGVRQLCLHHAVRRQIDSQVQSMIRAFRPSSANGGCVYHIHAPRQALLLVPADRLTQQPA